MANNAKSPCKRKNPGERSAVEAKKKKANIQNVESPMRCHSQEQQKAVSVFTVNAESNHCAITHEQLSELINHAVLGELRSPLPSWCQIHRQKELKGVAVIVLHGVSQMHFYRYYLQFKQLRKKFRFRFSMPPPPPDDFLLRIFGTEKLLPQDKSPTVNGTSAVNGHCLMTENNSCKPSDLDKHPIIIKYGRRKRGLTSYLLSEEELTRNDYPVADIHASEGFVQSGCTAKVTDNSPLLGLDCEMCLTTKGNELTRVSLVNAEGHCVMDELVKPDNLILNYLTRREIQSEQVVGHDASEDARAALELAQYFIDHGPMEVAKLNLENFQDKQPARESFTPQPEGRNQANGLSDHLKAKCKGVDGKPCFHSGSLLKKLCMGDQKAVLLGTKKAMKELIHQEVWHKIECGTDKEVVQQAQTEIPVASLSLSHFSSYSEYIECNLHMKIHEGLLHEKMRQKLSEMCTVYAGPFCKDFCLESVKRTFQDCGSIGSISVITETHKPYVCIEYELPESAHLAVLTLNGSILDGFLITVQRPIKENTLDCDTVLWKLEKDITSQAVIYVSGIQQTMTKEELSEKFSKFGRVEGVICLGDNKADAKPEDCFIKYGSSESAAKAQVAMNGQEVRKRRLNVLRALTPYHLQTWASQRSHTAVSPKTSDPVPSDRKSFERRTAKLSQCEGELKDVMRTIDRRVGRLFKALTDNTLCMVLLPGTNSAQCSAPGLCLLEMKQNP
ncbi:RNA exonuclease 5 isoform X2 [Mustelus asterias]